MRVVDPSRAEALDEAVSMAERDAARAAHEAGARILDAHDERTARRISRAGELVWGPRGTFAPNELRALAFSGNPVHLAVDERDGALLGFAVGFVGWSPVLHVHSHQAGVVPGRRRRGVGYALKLAQRQTCLAHGITEMRWTFDPLVRRNVAFNLNGLGAEAVAFYPDFYGAMSDSINSGDVSDRLEARWQLDRPLHPPAGPPPGEFPALLVHRDGRPALTGHRVVAGAVVEIPDDYEKLRAGDPQRSRAWRTAVREVLIDAYAAGFRIGAVDERGYRLVASGGQCP